MNSIVVLTLRNIFNETDEEMYNGNTEVTVQKTKRPNKTCRTYHELHPTYPSIVKG